MLFSSRLCAQDTYQSKFCGGEKIRANFSAPLIILVPGAGSVNENLFLGYINVGEYFKEISSVLKKLNTAHEILPSLNQGNDSVEQRVTQLRNKIAKHSKVFLIGHSLGGLVARLVLKDPLIARNVSGVLQLSAVNRGTEVADYLMAESKQAVMLKKIAQVFGFDLNQKKYFTEISVENSEYWNQSKEELNGVPILSIAAESSPRQLLREIPPFYLGNKIICQEQQKNSCPLTDGLISEASQIWNTCLMKVQANHGSIIGKTLYPSSHQKFNAFFTFLVEQLTRQGFITR